MDFTSSALFFLIGLGAAYVAGRRVRLGRQSAESRGFPLEGGSVRLDLLAGGPVRPRPEDQAGDGVRAEVETELASPYTEPEEPAPVEKQRSRQSRARKRR